MRSLIIVAVLFAPSIALAQGQHWVNGHYRSDGAYVQGHMQTNPDGNRNNNWTTRGNVNPYTGQPGYRDPERAPGYVAPTVPNYYQPAPAPNYGGGLNRPPQRTCGYIGCP